jgi:hypothetical protein
MRLVVSNVLSMLKFPLNKKFDWIRLRYKCHLGHPLLPAESAGEIIRDTLVHLYLFGLTWTYGNHQDTQTSLRINLFMLAIAIKIVLAGWSGSGSQEPCYAGD